MVPFRQALAGIVRQLTASGGASLHESKCNLQVIRGLNVAAATLDCMGVINGARRMKSKWPSLCCSRHLDGSVVHVRMSTDRPGESRRGFATGEGPPEERAEIRSLQQILQDIGLQPKPSGKRMGSSDREDDEGPKLATPSDATVAASDDGDPNEPQDSSSSSSSNSDSDSDSDEEQSFDTADDEMDDDDKLSSNKRSGEMRSIGRLSGEGRSTHERSENELTGNDQPFADEPFEDEPFEDELSSEMSEVQQMWQSRFNEWAQQFDAASCPPPRLVSEYMFREDGSRIDDDSPLKVEDFWPTPESLPKLDIPNVPLEVHGSLPPGEISIESLMTKMDLADEGGLPSVYEMYAISEWEKAEAKRQAREKELKKQAERAAARVRVVDKFDRSHAVGKRKSSIARVWLKPGEGHVIINGRPHVDYFGELDHRLAVLQPFFQTGTLGGFDVRCRVKGGGLSGQSQAIRHGISKALQLWDPEMRPALRSAGLLTRDPRVVERKKPGKAKARKSFQWVKR